MELEKNYNDNYDANFEDLKGKTLVRISSTDDKETMHFVTDTGETYQLHYYEDCCASCSVDEIHGDLNDILNTPILLAEEVSSDEPYPELKAAREAEENKKKQEEGEDYYYYCGHESETWTFYKLSTIKGSVTIRWYGSSNGSSNGYYSESATFERLV